MLKRTDRLPARDSPDATLEAVDNSTDPGARTEVDPLKQAVPTDDVEAKRAKASVAKGLFGSDDSEDPVAVGRYQIETRRGAGGMGVVYEAWDPELERRVAVKLLHPEVSRDDKARARMLREARALARLSDPNVIQVYDVGTTQEQVFVAMELVDGNTLGDWMNEGPHEYSAVLERFVAAGRGLLAAHETGLVHRDFKPDNVLLGDDGRVRVLDFGLARAAPELDAAATGTRPISLTDNGALGEVSPSLKAALTQTGALVGTPLYMSPEQFEGRPADALSDQYSFCVSLYQGLYGQRPFKVDSIAALVRNVVAGKIQPPPVDTTVPAAIEKVLRRGMALDPAQRFPSMAELIVALETGEVGPAVAKGAGSRGLFLGLFGAAAVAGALAVAFGGGGDDETASATDAAATVSQGEVPVSDETTTAPVADPAEETGVAETPAQAATTGVDEQESGTETGAKETEEKPKVVKKARDYCFMHEDTYKLVQRAKKGQRKLKGKDGICYACRAEKRKNRIKRFSSYEACGAYYVCNESENQDCK
jgi:predicted Ser/Thr protein kinase